MPKPRELEQWGGEVHLPRWLRRLLRRPEPPGDTPEHDSEWRAPAPQRSRVENINRAATGSLVDLYNEGRQDRRDKH